MLRPLARRLPRGLRVGLGRVDAGWLGLLLGALVGVLGALAVAGFRALLFGMEQALLDARGGHLVAAAQAMPPVLRVLVSRRLHPASVYGLGAADTHRRQAAR